MELQSKKRVLVLNYEFPPLGGGGGVAAYKLAKGYIQNGYEVDYVTSWYKGLKKFEIVDGINVYRVRVIGRTGLQTATMLSLVSFPLTAFLTGVKLCLKNKYEFINTHFVVPTGPLGYVLSKLFRIKNILSLHGGDIYDPTKKSSPHKSGLMRFVVRFLLNRADVLVAQSTNTKENTYKYYGINKNIHIIPLAYEPFEFTPKTRTELGLSEDKKYVIGVGRLVKRKDFETFIKVIAKLPEDVHGIIVGEGPEREFLESVAGSENVKDRIHFVGQVTEEEKFQYLNISDVFLLSSIHEGFGIVLQEAMQVGLPIVATSNGGQVDIVEHGVNGFLFGVGDIESAIYFFNDIFKKFNYNVTIETNYIQKFNIIEVSKRYINILNENKKIIGIDARTLLIKGGSQTYANNLLKNFKSQNDYMLFGINSYAEFRCIPAYGNQQNPFFRLLWELIILPISLRLNSVIIFHGIKGVAPLSSSFIKIVTVHDLIVFRYPQMFTFADKIYWKYVVPIYIRRANYIIAVSEATKNDLVKFLRISESKISVIYEGYSANTYYTKNKSLAWDELKLKFGVDFAEHESKKIILNVNTIQPRKNIQNLIKVFNKIADEDSDVVLFICGKKGWKSKPIYDEYNKSPYIDRIFFFENLNDIDIANFYNVATVFVYPSFYEGFGLPILEAQASGCAVITSNISSMPEVSGDGALLINPYNNFEIEVAIKKVLYDREFRAELINKGKKNIIRFSWESCATQTENLYKKII